MIFAFCKAQFRITTAMASLKVKIALSFVLMAVVSCRPAYHDMVKLEQVSQKCRQGTSVTKEWLARLYSGQETAEPDQTTKCYFKCVLEEFGLLDTDGSIKLDAEHGHFAECREKSKDHNKDDLCDMAYHFNKCVHMQHPEMPIA